MKRVGLVTYYKENYGSVLQCYSTKHYLESLGLECHVLYRRYKSSISFERISNILHHALKALRYKGYLKQYMEMHKAMAREKGYLTEEAKSKLNDFIDKKIHPEGYSWQELCQIGKDNTYIAFVAGSDQIWNASINVDPCYFLKFTRKDKRIAFAPSFGVASIPAFNVKSVRDGIRGFDLIAVREETGERIVRQMSSVQTTRIADPVALLNKKEWQMFSASFSRLEFKYIFVHFLNRPSRNAIQCINRIIESCGLTAILFSYDYPEYSELKNAQRYNGDPVEYLALIDSAECVCTDSFHSTMFSMILNRKFFTFPRQYLHSSNQSSRIIDLLNRYSVSQYYISDNKWELPDWTGFDWTNINQKLCQAFFLKKSKKI